MLVANHKQEGQISWEAETARLCLILGLKKTQSNIKAESEGRGADWKGNALNYIGKATALGNALILSHRSLARFNPRKANWLLYVPV
jgi:hypothetical protein